MDNSIFDYLNFYKDTSFKEVKFNIMDALLFSMIVYIPITNMREGTSLKTYYNMASNIVIKGTMANDAVKLLSVMSKSIRYSSVRLYSLVKEYNDEYEFGALTFRDYDYTFVAYQGSIGTISGWKENLYITLKYPTITQDVAVNYLKRVFKLKDRNLYLGGHSKGGNLALSSLLLSPSYINKRIVNVFNFDGPGFRNEEINSDKYKSLKDKMINILPDGSMIGILLNHDKYNFIKSKGVSIEKHFPTNWLIFGEFFIPCEENKASKSLHDKIKVSLDKLTDEEKKICIDTMFGLIKDKKIRSVRDFTSMSVEDYKSLLSSMKGIPSDRRKLMIDVFKIFVRSR